MQCKRWCILLGCALLLGCQRPRTQDVPSEMPLPDVPIEQGLDLSDEDAALLETVRVLTPDMQWSVPVRAMYAEDINVAPYVDIPSKVVMGVRMTASGRGLDANGGAFAERFTTQGWMVDNRLDADGVQGSVWGFQKAFDDTLRRYLILSWHQECSFSEESEQFVCGNSLSEVFLTDLVDPWLNVKHWDGRTFLNERVRTELLRKMVEAGNCGVEMLGGEPSFDPPSDTVSFRSSNLGFAAELPFNPSWGTPEYAVLPYEVLSSDDGVVTWVAFGPVAIDEGCGVGQTWSIDVGEWKTPEEIARRADADLAEVFLDEPVPEQNRARIMAMGDHQVVRYIAEGFCTTLIVEVPGPRYTYRISHSCGGGSDEELAIIERIVRSMTFLH